MGKKTGILLFACIVAITGTLAFKLMQSRAQLQLERQAMAPLTAELGALKNRKPEVVSCPAAIPAAEPQTEVQAVLDPQDGDRQTRIDTLKKRYEEMLVTYFVLRQCNKVILNDYHVIVSALSQEMASLNAPGRLQYDILTSAEGSYRELYSGNQCDPAAIEPLRQKYQAFIDAVAVQFMPH